MSVCSGLHFPVLYVDVYCVCRLLLAGGHTSYRMNPPFSDFNITSVMQVMILSLNLFMLEIFILKYIDLISENMCI